MGAFCTFHLPLKCRSDFVQPCSKSGSPHSAPAYLAPSSSSGISHHVGCSFRSSHLPTMHVPTSGPLPLLMPLPDCSFSQTFTFGSLPRCCLIREALSDHPILPVWFFLPSLTGIIVCIFQFISCLLPSSRIFCEGRGLLFCSLLYPWQLEKHVTHHGPQ